MGIFDKAENEAENLAQKDPNLTDKGLNELGQEANQMTGDRFGNQINEGVQAAENRLGQQGGGQGQGQGGYQDPNQGGYQETNQGGVYQDQDQGGYQDQNQGGYDQNQGQDQDQGQGQGW
jgi:hypothetical protein